MMNTQSIDSLLDRIGWGHYHNKLFFNCMGGWLVGGMWFAACPLITAQMAEITHFEQTILGAVLSAGGFLGSFLFSLLSDRLGRALIYKNIVLVTLLGAALLLTSFHFAMTLAALFLIGMGAGGDTSVPANVMLDFTPSTHKGRVALMNIGSSLGPIIANITGLFLVNFWNFSPERWRVMCAVCALITVVFACLRRGLLESPVYLYNAGKVEEYVSVVNELAQINGRYSFLLGQNSELGDLLLPVEEEATKELTMTILDRKNISTTVKLAGGQLLSSFSASSLLFFLTFFYQFETESDLYTILIVMQVAGILTAAQSAFLISTRLGRRWTYSLMYTFAAGFVLIYAATNKFWALLLLAGLYNTAVQNGSAAKNLIAPESYDSRIRGQAVGSLAALSRVAGIASPIFIGNVHSMLGGTACLIVISGTFLATGCIASTLKETRIAKKYTIRI